jgi:uncharacterized protein YoxC
MTGKTIRGITLEIGGDTTTLNKALSEVNTKSKDLQSELKQVEKLLKLDPKNTELLAQKQKLLGEAIANSKEKLDKLRDAQKQVNDQFEKGEISEKQYRAFQREVAKAEQELDKFEKQLKQTGITAEQMGKSIKAAGDKMTDIGKNLSMKVTAPIVGVGAAAFKFGADLEDAFGATDQIFKDAGESVKQWAGELQNYYGIAESEALTYANTMGAMLQNIGGLSEEEAAKQSQTLVQLAGDLTAMFGGTTESAVQALTGALKGNNSMLDNYGMGVNEATIKTKALEMGLIKEGQQLDLAGKQAATLALIMEQTADAQGQAAREADGASGTLRGLTTELKNVAGELGQVLIPMLNPFVAKLKEMVEKFGGMTPAAQKIVIVVAGIAAAIGPLLVVFGTLASSVGSIIALFGGGAAAGGGLGAALAAITGPIGLAVAAIAGLIAVFVGLYKNNEEFRNSVKKTWDDVKGSIREAIDQITKWWEEWGPKIMAVVEPLWETIKTIIMTVMKVVGETIALVLNVITGDWEGAKNNLLNIAQALWEGLKGIFQGIYNTLTSLTSLLTDLMLKRWETFKAGLISIWGAITNAIKGYVNNQIAFVNKLIDALNSIQVEIPEWVPGVGGHKFGIDLPHVPYLAKGGIVTRPTLAMIGEAGPEAVVPLNQSMAPVIHEINIYGNNADEVWEKFERELRRRGVRF